MEDRQIAALFVLPIALIGVTCNWTVALSSWRLPTLKNAFGKLTASQSFGDAVHSSFFLFYFVPMCLTNSKFMIEHSAKCGHILLIAYDISTYSHFFISLNRFCSIFSPIKYERIFSPFHTNCLIFTYWCVAIVSSIYFYILNDCEFVYYDQFWVFVFSTTPVCQKITWYADFLKYNSIVISIVIIDIITVTKVRLFNKKLLKNTNHAGSSAKKRHREINFLKQACLQAVVFVFELITYFVITPKVADEYRWTRFFLSTVAWVVVHTADGIITISFNSEFATFIGGRCKKIKPSNSTTARVSHHNSGASQTKTST